MLRTLISAFFVLSVVLSVVTACQNSADAISNRAESPESAVTKSAANTDEKQTSGSTAVAAGDEGPVIHKVTIADPTAVPTGIALLAMSLRAESDLDTSPLMAARIDTIKKVLANPRPVLELQSDLLTEAQTLAQALALSDQTFLRFTRQGRAATPLLNEVMSVRPTLPSDTDLLADSTAATPCDGLRCFRVELYNYAYNLTTVAIVDIEAKRLLDVTPYPHTQPDIPDHLIALAQEIAVTSPEVAEALGYEPSAEQAVMANIKTALNSSRCERSNHLCVAPTFIVNDRALWAIVDLTDQRLVGIRWTELGTTTVEPAITEESLQNEVVTERFCERSNHLEQSGWSFDYMLTSSDGLRLSNVQYQGKQVMRSAKLVDWHVSYSQKEGFGYSDAVGCPIFSSAAVIAYNGPQIQEITEAGAGAGTGDGAVVGFAFVQGFMGDGWPHPCHYRYEQRYEFYNDGRFRVGGANLGRGCGREGVYRPVLRIDITAGGSGNADSFAEWTEDGWSTWAEEAWRLQSPETAYSTEGHQYRITDDSGGGYDIIPGNGQFEDGGRGDNAYVYVTKRHADQDEGDADLITIGSCCNPDHQQGPEQFMEPAEEIESADLVLWYVAQMTNDDTPGSEYCWADAVIEEGVTVNRSYPCAFGPLFVPIE